MEIGDVSFYGILPILIFAFTLSVLTMVRSIARTNYVLHRQFGTSSTIAAAVGSLLVGALRWRQFDIGELDATNITTLNGFVSTDRLSAISIIVVSAIVVIAALVAYHYLASREDIPAGEFFILLQCAALGMFAIAMANDLMAMFVALEVFSIPLYVLTAFDRRRVRSLEGGFKYFIMGAVASAIFLYGIALHYGVTGSTALTAPLESTNIALVSSVFISVGLLFKVAGVPFHFWSPDAYQGAPSPVTLYMAAATKLVAFIALVRLISSGVLDVSDEGSPLRLLFTVVCIASCVVGSFFALRQSNLKRALAYSSITHTAYIVLALKAGTSIALQAVVAYVVIYAFVIAGSFAIVSFLASPDEQNDSIAGVKGLASRNPWLAGSFTVLLFSQAGIPLTSGFIAKFEVFRAAFASEFYFSGIIVLVATVIAAAFYLRIVLSMYSDSFGHDVSDSGESKIVPPGTSVAVGICVVVTVAVGILPTLVTGFTHVL